MNPADLGRIQEQFQGNAEKRKGFADKGDLGPVVEFNMDPGPTFHYRLSEVTLGTREPYVGQPFGSRRLVNNNVEVDIECFLIGGSGQDTVAALNKVENKVSEVLSKGKPRLAITHYNAFDRDVLRNKANAGDVIANVKVDGKPVAGEKVYFFLAAGKNDDSGALFLPDFMDSAYLSSSSAMHVAELGSNLVNFGSYKAVTTDAKGNASFNYIRDNYINYPKLEQWLREHGRVKYYVIAYVFEEPLEKTRQEGTEPKIKCYAITPVEYTSMAAIVDVAERDLYNVRVIKPPETFPGQTVHAENCPYGISPGDFVLMAEGTSVTVAWIPGERLQITPKEEYFREGPQYATFTIGSKDMGWTQTAIETVKTLETIHLAATPVEILYTGHIAKPVMYALALSGVSAVVEKKLEAMKGPVEIEPVTGPIYIVPHSRILIDLGNTTTIYTLEGTGTVYNATGTSVDVTTGNMIAVAKEGMISPVSTFSNSQLSADQKRLLTYAQAASPATASPDPTGQPSVAPSKQSPAPGLLTGALAILVVVFLLQKRRGS